jgi:4-hydroxybutyrate CoA-transferase
MTTPKESTAEECVEFITSHSNVFIHSGVSTPALLVSAMVARAKELKEVKIYQIHTEGDCSYAKPDFRENFIVHNFFNGSNMRATLPDLTAHYVPIFLSEIPYLFYNGIVKLDVAMLQLSPPDSHGMCSLGPSVDISISAARTAKIIIAQINKQMPRTFGDSQIHISKISAFIEVDEPLYETEGDALSKAEVDIGSHVASLIEDGATLQMGIGAIPNAVLNSLYSHKDLGIHTEMFSDGVIELYQRGIINGRLKVKHPGKIVTSFAIGSRRLYDFIDDNPGVLFLDCSYTNSTHVIAQNPKVTAINSAVEIDLTGQVCADSIGSRIYSGVGGQMDFIRGASLSKGGTPIIALSSTTSKGQSKLVAQLKPGAGVVTTRAHVHYVVTEFGVANLYGKSIKERVRALINIAHPNHRESLEKEAWATFKF